MHINSKKQRNDLQSRWDSRQPVLPISNDEMAAIAHVARQSEWQENVAVLLRREARQQKIDIPRMFGVVDHILSRVTVEIEKVQFDVAKDQNYVDPARYPKGYFAQPVISVRKNEGDGFTSSIQSATLGKKFFDIGLLLPEDVADLDKIESQNEVISAMFWAEIQSLHNRQRDWTVGGRYYEIAGSKSAEHHETAAILAASVGHRISGTRARDSTGRWAYYCSYLTPEKEAAYHDALAQQEVMDLEDFGPVLESTYEHEFRKRQKLITHSEVQRLFDHFASKRHAAQSFSFAKRNSARVPFQERRFRQAEVSLGSRSALFEEINRVFDLTGPPAQSIRPLSQEELYPYARRLKPEYAGAMATLVETRHLGAGSIAFLVDLLATPSLKSVECVLSMLRTLVHRVGTDEAAVNRFMILICHNRALSNADALDAAIDLAKPGGKVRQLATSLISAAIDKMGLAPKESSRSRAITHWPQRNREIESFDWSQALTAVAAGDMLSTIGSENRAALVACITAYVVAADSSSEADACKRALALIEIISEQSTEQKPVFFGEEIERAGVQLGSNIVSRTIDFYLRKEQNEHKTIICHFMSKSFMLKLQAISCFGSYIERLSDQHKEKFVEGVIRNSLEELFEQTGTPYSQRDRIITDLARQITRYDRQCEKVVEDTSLTADADQLRTHDETSALPYRRTLPTSAPVLWRNAKAYWQEEMSAGRVSHDDELNPPNFIKHVYQPWLRVDGSGLTRPDLKWLDQEKRDDGTVLTPLYTALNNWLRTNKIPDDVPLPTKSAWIDKVLEKRGEEAEAVMRGGSRMRAWKHRRADRE